MVKIKIRKFRKEDIKNCVNIIMKTLGLKDAKKAEKDLLIGLNKKEWTKICRYLERFVILIEDKIVGICGLYDHRDNSRGYIGLAWYAVDPKYQKIGIGSKLLQEAIIKSRKMRYKYLFVWSDDKAVGFYEKFGFNISKRKIVPIEGDCLLIKKI